MLCFISWKTFGSPVRRLLTRYVRGVYVVPSRYRSVKVCLYSMTIMWTPVLKISYKNIEHAVSQLSFFYIFLIEFRCFPFALTSTSDLSSGSFVCVSVVVVLALVGFVQGTTEKSHAAAPSRAPLETPPKFPLLCNITGVLTKEKIAALIGLGETGPRLVSDRPQLYGYYAECSELSGCTPWVSSVWSYKQYTFVNFWQKEKLDGWLCHKNDAQIQFPQPIVAIENGTLILNISSSYGVRSWTNSRSPQGCRYSSRPWERKSDTYPIPLPVGNSTFHIPYAIGGSFQQIPRPAGCWGCRKMMFFNEVIPFSGIINDSCYQFDSPMIRHDRGLPGWRSYAVYRFGGDIRKT